MKIEAIAYEDIPANRLVGLKGAHNEDGLDINKIYIKLAERDWHPDMVSSRFIEEGETVSISILGNPVWEAELSKDTRPGTMVSADNDGKICSTNTRDFERYVGYSIEGGKAGDTIKYVRKTGVIEVTTESETAGMLDDVEI